MAFDFFNLSNLAFGNKLTIAFTQLESLVKEARNHIETLISDLRVYGQYLNRNYQIDAPAKADEACRSNELFQIISERVIVNDISYEGGELSLDCVVYNPDTSRITKLQGYTTLTAGYCYFNYAISNSDVARTAMFFEDENTNHGVKLFKFTTNRTAKTAKIDWAIR